MALAVALLSGFMIPFSIGYLRGDQRERGLCALLWGCIFVYVLIDWLLEVPHDPLEILGLNFSATASFIGFVVFAVLYFKNKLRILA